MALCFGTMIDCLICIEHGLEEDPDGRYLIWRIGEGDPWNVSSMEKWRSGLPAVSMEKFKDVMIVDARIMADLKGLVVRWKVGV